MIRHEWAIAAAAAILCMSACSSSQDPAAEKSVAANPVTAEPVSEASLGDSDVLKVAGGVVPSFNGFSASQKGQTSGQGLFSGVYVCTAGDVPTRIVGAELISNTKTQVLGFDVTRDRDAYLDDGEDSGATLHALRDPELDNDPSELFSQTCDTTEGTGTTSVSVEFTTATLPLSVTGVLLRYETTTGQAGVLRAGMEAVVCGFNV